MPITLAVRAAEEVLVSPFDGDGTDVVPPPVLTAVPSPAENDAAMADLMAKLGAVRG